MNKNDVIIFGAGIIAGFILVSVFSAKKKDVVSQEGDAEYFAFADGGVKLGDKGHDVDRLKIVVNKFGYNIPVDGLYDKKTKSVINKALSGTTFLNNRRNEGEVDIRFVNGMERIFENATSNESN